MLSLEQGKIINFVNMRIEKLFWLLVLCFLVGALGLGLIVLTLGLGLAIRLGNALFMSLPFNSLFFKAMLLIGGVGALFPLAAVFAGILFLIKFVWKKVRQD